MRPRVDGNQNFQENSWKITKINKSSLKTKISAIGISLTAQAHGDVWNGERRNGHDWRLRQTHGEGGAVLTTAGVSETSPTWGGTCARVNRRRRLDANGWGWARVDDDDWDGRCGWATEMRVTGPRGCPYGCSFKNEVISIFFFP